MTHQDASRVAEILSERTCHVGDDIELRPRGDTIYIVKSGRVRLESGNIAIGVLGSGELFGTSSLVGEASADERAVAMEESILCEAPAGAFLTAMTSHPLLAARIAQLLARQLHALERSVQRAAEDPVEARLAALVLQLAECDDHGFVRDLSQADLARMIGASRESVSRAMTTWERDGLIRTRHRTVQVADVDGLRSRVTGRSAVRTDGVT